jgi:hypothetical protein
MKLEHHKQYLKSNAYYIIMEKIKDNAKCGSYIYNKDTKQINKEKEKKDLKKCCALIKRNKSDDPKKCQNNIFAYNFEKIKEIFKKHDINDDEYLKLLENNNNFCFHHLESYLEEMHNDNIIYTEDNIAKFNWCSTCSTFLDPKKFIGGLCYKCKQKCENNKIKNHTEFGNIKCCGYVYNKDTGAINKCNRYANQKCENKYYCDAHVYLKNFTEEEINNIVLGKSADIKVCTRCIKFAKILDGTLCNCCKKKNKEYMSIKRNGEKEERNECCVMIKRDNEEKPYKCTYEILGDNDHEFKRIMLELNIVDDEYRKWLRENNIFCIAHLKRYLKEMYENDIIYSYEDVEEFKWCSTCRNYNNPDNFIGGLCSKCYDISNQNRKKEREIKKNNERCKYEECEYEAIKYKVSTEEDGIIIAKKNNLDNVFGNYCGKHQVYAWIKKMIREGKKVCAGWEHHGCRVILENDSKSKCQDCLNLDNQREKNRQENAKLNKKEKKINNNGKPKMLSDSEDSDKSSYFDDSSDTNTDKDENSKMCSTCLKTLDLKNFIGNKGQETKQCLNCRQKNARADEKRQNRDRKEQFKEYEKRPERQQAKKEWKETNPEKSAIYSSSYRIRKILEMGYDEFKKHHTNIHRIYLDKNPLSKINAYKERAKSRNLLWDLTDDEAKKIFQNECFYCGQSKISCGIDRKNPDGDYTTDNCVSCCSQCNMHKCDLYFDDFLNIVKHILSFLGLLKNKYKNFDLFFGPKVCSYNDYKIRAQQQNKDFQITQNEYDYITNLDCYICGRKNINTPNGIDKINNNNGYIIGNIAPCCTVCNYLKYTYDLSDVFRKLYEIGKIHFKEDIIIFDLKEIKEIKEKIHDKLQDKKNEIFELLNNFRKKEIKKYIELGIITDEKQYIEKMNEVKKINLNEANKKKYKRNVYPT